MKLIRGCLFFAFLFFSSQCLGQAEEHEDYAAFKKSPNYLKCILVTHDRDSIPALMENFREPYKRFGDKSGKINLILSTDGRKTLRADEFKGYELTLRNKKTIRFFAIDGTIVNVKVKGDNIKLFEREEFVIKAPKSAIMVSSNVRKRYFVRKKYEAYLTDVDDISDQKSLADYFSDCPALSQKIEQNRIKVRDIVSLVQRYDGCEGVTGN